MAKKTLKPGDGFKSQRPEMRDEVKKMQTLLREAGYPVDVDGFFGKGTAISVNNFQKDHGLGVDGVVGPTTWNALEGDERRGAVLLKGFRGDLAWVHAREGYAGKAYWPGGESGVTLDPGMDLGYAAPELVEKLYAALFSPAQLDAVKGVYGVRGKKAKEALSLSPDLKSIRISRAQSDEIFPYAADPYWVAIFNRFTTLSDRDTPSSVQTVMLSLSYNRGASNRALDVLRNPIEEKDWRKVGGLIGAMQQDHKLEGIRKRRRMEAELIESQVA